MKPNQAGDTHRVLGRLSGPYIKSDIKGICTALQGIYGNWGKKCVMKIQYAACISVKLLGMSYVAFFTGAYAAPVELKRCCRKRYNVLKIIERKISKIKWKN